MKLNRLDIIGFGKFINKSLKFKDGINIIYGENESGKTTIHNFIDGMFYGFLKANMRTVRYLDEHKLYEPWNKNKYAGIVSFIHNNQGYRIERDFTKSNEETKIFLESTGEDITDRVDTGSRTRVLQPGFHFFGFNGNVFRNTISIRQLKTKTEKELSKEIKEKLINASQSLDDQVSVKDAIKSLDDDLKKIGSLKAPTSKYARTMDQIRKLKEDINNIKLKKDDYNELLRQADQLEKDLKDNEIKLENKDQLLEDIRHLELGQIYNNGLEQKVKIQDLEDKLKEVESYKDICQDDFDKANEDYKELKIIENNLVNKKTSQEKIQDKILELDGKIISLEDNIDDDISKDYLDLEIMEEERIVLNKNFDQAKSDYESRLKREKNKQSQSKIGLGLSVLVFIIFSVILEISIPIILGAGIVFIISLLTLINSTNKVKDSGQEDYEDIVAKLDQIDKERERILKKHNVEYLAQLKSLYDNIKYNKLQRESLVKQIENYQIELEETEKDINRLKEEERSNRNSISYFLEKNKLSNMEEFQEAVKEKINYDKIFSALDNKKILYNKIMDGHSLEKLQEKLGNYRIKSKVDIGSKDLILEEKKSLAKEITNINLEMTRNETKLKNLEEYLNSMVAYEEELSIKEDLTGRLDKEIAAINLAKSTIEDLSKDIHEGFAPQINEKVSEIIGTITNGKYNRIKVDDKLGLGIINPESNEILKDRSLSGGTIDQLYFSLRFGLIRSISKDNLPLILDDCFIQYDDSRLKNVLELISKLGDQRQIIIFTCHNREKRFLNDLGIEYNLINL